MVTAAAAPDLGLADVTTDAGHRHIVPALQGFFCATRLVSVNQFFVFVCLFDGLRARASAYMCVCVCVCVFLSSLLDSYSLPSYCLSFNNNNNNNNEEDFKSAHLRHKVGAQGAGLK